MLLECLVAISMSSLDNDLLWEAKGKCSYFVATRRSAINEKPPSKFYVACRWDYKMLSELKGWKNVKKELKENCFMVVTNPVSKKSAVALISDWGPHKRTGRKFDLSLPLMRYLEVETDDVITGQLRYKHDFIQSFKPVVH